nr:DMT family transporter [Pyrobaculum sp.]
MVLPGLFSAIIAATIWALVIFLYKKYMESHGALVVNFSRLFYVSTLMSPVLILITPSQGLWAAAFSGIITLLVGDSLYFYAIHKVGGSIAAPLTYTYIIIAQYFSLLLGEQVTPLLIVSSLLIVLGVSLLTRGGEAKLSAAGVGAALLAALMWSLGMTAIKLAALQGVSPIIIAYIRALSAGLLLGLYLWAKGRLKVVKSPVFAIASLLDLGAGSALFAYSVERVGLALSTILVSIAPLITQLFAKISGLERLTYRQMLGAVVIFLAIVLAVSSIQSLPLTVPTTKSGTSNSPP